MPKTENRNYAKDVNLNFMLNTVPNQDVFTKVSLDSNNFGNITVIF